VHVIAHGNLTPHTSQQRHGGGDIIQMWHVTDSGFAAAEQRGRKNGQHGVLRARNAHITNQR